MVRISCKTKDGYAPGTNRRVYFACHPEDFENCFSKVCNDFFSTHDCSIFYTTDMKEEISDQDIEVAIGSNHLFVLPITYKLLFSPNRAIDIDFPYAQSVGMPILPIIMELGAEELYASDDRFGTLQYLNAFSSDTTAISYAQKLKKYLDAVLISDEMAKRVRAAFDAYIFLSYRKKDRSYANELMQIIHRNPECQDIAIWYDEFLTPGESFKDNIIKMMRDSKLFALLVTPNLLEEPDGKPNYVMGAEYPSAKEMGLPILPAEMQPTDKEILRLKFKDIPACIDPHQEQDFHALLIESLSRIARNENDNDIEHNFLIGLAYYEGIDVETNRERGIRLITEAAESGLLEAMRWLIDMYNSRFEEHTALAWHEKILQHQINQLGQTHKDTIDAMIDLSGAFLNIGDVEKALKLREDAYQLAVETFGENDSFVLGKLSSLAHAYYFVGNHEKELELLKEIYKKKLHIIGKNNINTISALEDIANKYSYIGEDQKALQLQKKIYRWKKKYYGRKHSPTTWDMSDLARHYNYTGNYRKELRLRKKIYSLECQKEGAESSAATNALYNIASTYYYLGKFEKAAELTEKVIEHRRMLLGNAHYDTVDTFIQLARIFYNAKKQTGISRIKQIISEYESDIKEESFETAGRLDLIAQIYAELHEYEKVVQSRTQVYDMSYRLFGAEHRITRQQLNKLADAYYDLACAKKDIEPIYKAIRFLEKAYSLSCKVLGKEKYETLQIAEKEVTLYKHLLAVFKTRANQSQSEVDLVDWAETSLEYAITLIYAKKYEDVEVNLATALQIYENLNPEKYCLNIGIIYFQYAELHFQQNEYIRSEQYLLKAITTLQTCANNEERFLSWLGTCYNNLGYAYKNMIQYEKAEEAYLEAYKIAKELAGLDPDKYNSKWMIACEKLISFYNLTGQVELKNIYNEELVMLGE